MQISWNTISKRLYLIIPFLFLLGALFLALNGFGFSGNSNAMTTALTIDFVITIPLVYAFLIRKKSISRLTIVPFFVVGLVLASFLIPPEHQGLLNLIKTWMLPVVELTVFVIIFRKVAKLRRNYKEQAQTLGFYEALAASTEELFPPFLAKVLTNEVSMFYFCFFTWKKPKLKQNEFTHHKNGSERITLGVLLFVSLIELFAVHLLFVEDYPILTWILTIISTYGSIQILGIIKSISRMPYRVTDKGVYLKMGILKRTFIPLESIAKIEFTLRDFPEDDPAFKKLGLFDHNCIIHCSEEMELHALFGTKTYKHLVLSVDEKEAFLKAIESAQKEN